MPRIPYDTIREHPDLSIPKGGRWWVARCHFCSHMKLTPATEGEPPAPWWKGDKHRCIRGRLAIVIWE